MPRAVVPALADVAAPAPGLCARSELQIDARVVNVHVLPDRSVPIRLRCAAAPGACRGMLRVRIRGHRGGPLRFSVPQGSAPPSGRGCHSPRCVIAACRS